MARQVNPEEHSARRREILDAALRVMHDKGYERMTIQDVLAEVQMSKGALYHYFGSKQALLEGIVDAMATSGIKPLRAIVEDSNLCAVDKIRAYFEASAAWKSENLVAVTTGMRLWRHENNALLRHKVSQESMRTTAPLLEVIIRQGCDEGVFDTTYPREAALVITGMDLQMADVMIDAIEADGSVWPAASGPHLQRVVAAYAETFERILGAPPGTLMLTDS